MEPELLPSEIPVESGRFTIRRWTAADEPAMSAAITASVEHLRPWMAWIADEPVSPADRLALIETWDAEFHAGGDAPYAIFVPKPDGPTVGGSVGLHRRSPGRPDIVEVGYWLHVDFVGRGIMTEAVQAVTDAAFALAGTSVVEVLHDPANTASAAVPARLGFQRLPDTAHERGCHATWAVTRSGWVALCAARSSSDNSGASHDSSATDRRRRTS